MSIVRLTYVQINQACTPDVLSRWRSFLSFYGISAPRPAQKPTNTKSSQADEGSGFKDAHLAASQEVELIVQMGGSQSPEGTACLGEVQHRLAGERVGIPQPHDLPRYAAQQAVSQQQPLHRAAVANQGLLVLLPRKIPHLQQT